MSGSAEPGWQAGVFAHRESAATLLQCIDALAAAARRPLLIDLLVNGNAALAEAMRDALQRRPAGPPALRLRLWRIAAGDKAHAWNELVHRLAMPGHALFCVDGYVRVQPGALAALDEAGQHEGALAAAGVPSSGRTAARLAQQMLSEGGLHGNLFMLRADTVARLRRENVRLPVGLYRTDAALGAFLSFGLDPAQQAWAPKRFIALTPGAGWDVDDKHWWRAADLRSKFKRIARQARGDLENQAAREHLALRRQPPAALPGSARELVLRWAEACPEALASLHRRRPLTRWALRELRRPQDWSAAAEAPHCLFDSALLR